MERFHNIYHLPHTRQDYLSVFYIVATLRTFAISMLGLFFPIFLYDLLTADGYSQQSAFILVGLTFLMLYFTYMNSVIIVNRLIAKIGIRSGFIIGQILFVLFIIFSRMTTNYDYLLLSFSLWGLAASFWWISYHNYFLDIGTVKQYGSQLGLLAFLGIAASVAAPLVGGLVISIGGYISMFLVAIAIVMLTILLLVFSEKNVKMHAVYLKDVIREIKAHKRDFLGFVGAGGEEALYSVAWPLLLHVVLKDILEVGIFSTIIVFLSAFTAIYVGKLSDRLPRKKLQKLGSGIVGLSWLGKMFVQHTSGLFLLEFFYRSSENLLRIPLDAISFTHAIAERKGHSERQSQYVVFREVGISIGNILGMGAFIGFVILGFPFTSVFFIGALFALLTLVVRE
ncbi:MAG: hypothetical protein RI947_191 [Candidatus Parcubacteria bacterium]|jgi:MFS family permease